MKQHNYVLYYLSYLSFKFIYLFSSVPFFLLMWVFLFCSSFTELDKELSTLRTGLKEIEKELEFFQNQAPETGDRFVTVMNQFATVASYNFSEVEESSTEMKQKVMGSLI